MPSPTQTPHAVQLWNVVVTAVDAPLACAVVDWRHASGAWWTLAVKATFDCAFDAFPVAPGPISPRESADIERQRELSTRVVQVSVTGCPTAPRTTHRRSSQPLAEGSSYPLSLWNGVFPGDTLHVRAPELAPIDVTLPQAPWAHLRAGETLVEAHVSLALVQIEADLRRATYVWTLHGERQGPLIVAIASRADLPHGVDGVEGETAMIPREAVFETPALPFEEVRGEASCSPPDSAPRPPATPFDLAYLAVRIEPATDALETQLAQRPALEELLRPAAQPVTEAKPSKRDEVTARLAAKEPLRGLDLSGADLSDLDLRHESFVAAQLTGADLSRTRLDGASFKKAKLDGANLSGAAAAGVSFEGASLDGARFIDATLLGADLHLAHGANVCFDGARLERADLRQAKLVSPSFRRADLAALDGARAGLAAADFTDANLAKSILRGARLSRARFAGADLRDADLRDADLRGADLATAKREGALTRGARTEGDPDH